MGEEVRDVDCGFGFTKSLYCLVVDAITATFDKYMIVVVFSLLFPSAQEACQDLVEAAG